MGLSLDAPLEVLFLKPGLRLRSFSKELMWARGTFEISFLDI